MQYAWSLAAPELTGTLNRRAELADALQALATAGRLLLPRSSWERAPRPQLPRFVTVPAARREPRDARRWRARSWHPSLAWVASLSTLSDPALAALEAIDRWLRAQPAGAPDLLPMRVRSAEIFGQEKLLDALSTSALFAEGRLSLELLGARRFPPPLVLHRVAPGPDVLVVENADTLWICRVVLSRLGGSIGRIGWGAGAAFERSIAALELEAERPRRLLYWG